MTNKFWIVVPSGEGGRGMGLGRDIQGASVVFVMFRRIWKITKCSNLIKLGGGYHRFFFIFFLVFSMFLIFYNLKFFLPQKEKMCWVVRPYSEWSLTNLLLEFVLYQCQLSFAAISVSALVPHTYKFEFAYLLVRKPGFEAFLEVHIT